MSIAPLRIAHISFSLDPSYDLVYGFECLGRTFEVQRYGTALSVPYFKSLVASLRSQVDAFAYSGLPPVVRIGDRSYFHSDYLDVMNLPASVPVCDGYRVRELFTANSLVSMVEDGTIDPDQGIFFPMGVSHPEVIRILKQRYASSLYMADAASLLGVPVVLKPEHPLLSLAAPLATVFLAFRSTRSMMPSSRQGRKLRAQELVLDNLAKAQYIFSDPYLLSRFGDQLTAIRGKEIIVPLGDPRTLAELQRYGPEKIHELLPPEFKFAPSVNFSIIDAAYRLALGRFQPLSVEEWEAILERTRPVQPIVRRHLFKSRASSQRQVVARLNRVRNRLLSRDQKAPDFAFIVHPLTVGDLFRVPGLGALRRLPEQFHVGLERGLSRVPGFVLGSIDHIVSQKNAREVRGLIYALPATPRFLMEEDPQETYRRIESICIDAARRGARLIGLGAYTKIVGDAGLSIHRNSPIPVTTGNSLSSSATLWAVYQVTRTMGLIPMMQDGRRFDGTAMVIGATGSIGKVSSKLLSRGFRRLRLVAPRAERLDELVSEIRTLSPDCDVVGSTRAVDFAADADVLITATSAFDQRVVDVDLLKPGCVVCDCSRPLDFTLEDAIRRPDIVIIESGEVDLPGPVNLSCDIGLPGSTVYACLGETAVLAMEGRAEPFSMGRDLDWQKVKEIYQLARSHGVKLSAIRGHAGVITDRELALARDLALHKRANPGAGRKA